MILTFKKIFPRVLNEKAQAFNLGIAIMKTYHTLHYGYFSKLLQREI